MIAKITMQRLMSIIVP